MKKLLTEWKNYLNVIEEQEGIAPPPEKVDFTPNEFGQPGSGVSYYKSDKHREELENVNKDIMVPSYDERVEFHDRYPFADWGDPATAELKIEDDIQRNKLAVLDEPDVPVESQGQGKREMWEVYNSEAYGVAKAQLRRAQREAGGSRLETTQDKLRRVAALGWEPEDGLGALNGVTREESPELYALVQKLKRIAPGAFR